MGVTSNPTIFQGAIAEGDAYDEQMREVLQPRGAEGDLLELAAHDIQTPATLRPVYDEGRARTAGSRSRSTRTSPTTPSHDRGGRAPARARRPPEPAHQDPRHARGPAGDRGDDRAGIPVNVTLIFSLERHREVAEAYIRGLQRLVEGGGDPTRIASVASFFVSRVDTEADKRLDDIGGHDELKGKLAIANAKLAYQTYKEVFSAPLGGARGQGRHAAALPVGVDLDQEPRVPRHIYVEELIGPDTVNTMPRETIEAFPDHGEVATRSSSGVEGARKLFEDLAGRGRRLRRRHRDARARGRGEVRGLLRRALRRRRGQARPAGGR